MAKQLNTIEKITLYTMLIDGVEANFLAIIAGIIVLHEAVIAPTDAILTDNTKPTKISIIRKILFTFIPCNVAKSSSKTLSTILEKFL